MNTITVLKCSIWKKINAEITIMIQDHYISFHCHVFITTRFIILLFCALPIVSYQLIHLLAFTIDRLNHLSALLPLSPFLSVCVFYLYQLLIILRCYCIQLSFNGLGILSSYLVPAWAYVCFFVYSCFLFCELLMPSTRYQCSIF